MHVVFEKFETNPGHSFFVNDLIVNHFKSPIHYHPQIEITYIIQGTGMCFAGESVQPYQPGEIVILGDNIPHAFISSRDHYNMDKPKISRAINILFSKEMFGDTFLSMPENQFINSVFSDAKRCIRFSRKKSSELTSLIIKLSTTKGFERLDLLLQILYYMDSSEDKEFLNVPYLSYDINKEDMKRINKIYEYVFANYHNYISLKTIAEISNLSPQSFCRYFKNRTNKTFSKFLAEIRIGQASKLLKEDNKTVTDICYEVGFNHFSSFNKQFKNIMGTTALKYKKIQISSENAL
jgi:AraC-like DNA-binding protein